MYKDHYVSALIAAAGQGKRMESKINKQYLEMVNKPVLVHTLEAFKKSDYIDEVILIVREDEIQVCKDQVIDKYFSKDKIRIVSGGKERQESIYNGLLEISSESHIVVTHDGARPFVTKEIIDNSIVEAFENKAVGVGVPVKDTIKIVNNSYIVDTPERSKLWQIQTPQVFTVDILMEAHKKARDDNYIGTDDCVLVEKLGYRVKMVMGSYENIKITTPEDLIIGEAILNSKQNS